jgi:1-deoxy-D-xylulose-5-phosphate reductoisomerase
MMMHALQTEQLLKTGQAPRRVTILGSTGSIGTQTLDLIGRDPGAYQVVALTAHRNIDLLVEQAKIFKPEHVVVADDSQYQKLKEALAHTNISVAAGAAALEEAATMDAEWVMSAIVGAAGLPPTLAAARRGAMIAFANKETLVCAGPLMMKMVADCGATLLPVDSEHNAVWQVFDAKNTEAIHRIILTASGGPFRTATRAAMAKATVEEAVKHPTWTMGAKISVDSATMMNKGLEIIEARYLFDLPSEKIDVLVHPQSVIHSMVEYIDGSVLAQMGTPDMRTPISTTLAWPKRMAAPSPRLDLAQIQHLTFENPDPDRFPALTLVRQAMERGGTAPAILNAANEQAVAAFLARRIGFLDIEKVWMETIKQCPGETLLNLSQLAAADIEARRVADAMITTLTR